MSGVALAWDGEQVASVKVATQQPMQLEDSSRQPVGLEQGT